MLRRALSVCALAAALPAAALVPGGIAAAVAADEPLSAIERYKPSAIPDRVVLIPTDDPAHSQRISWRSNAETPKAQFIEAPAAFGDTMLDGLTPIDGTDYSRIITLDATTSAMDPRTGYLNRYHAVELRDLKPGTRYAYRVGDGTNPNGWPSTNWTAWEDFTTAEAGLRDFSFIYFGDAQNYIDSAVPRVFHQAVLDRPKAKLMIHAGDLVNQTGVTDENLQIQEKEWGEWYGAAGYNNQTRNILATPGNHEYNSSTAISAFWKPQFPFPANGPRGTDGRVLDAIAQSAYYVDYQGVRYISLDSNPLQNGPVQNDVLAAQTRWFEEVLSDPQRPKWTVVTFHHPVYAGTSTRNNQVVRDNWNPLIERYKVDLVLQGHDHVYNRGNEARDDDATDPTKSHGTVYSISVSGGKMYELNAGRNWSDNGARLRVAAQHIQLYQLIDVKQDTLTYQARLANGKYFDGYRVYKAGNGWDTAKTVQDLDRDPELPSAPAARTATAVSASSSEVSFGDPVTLSASVAPAAGGTVQFRDGERALGNPVETNAGVARLTTRDLAPGSHAISAVFMPTDDAAFATSTSGGVAIVVGGVPGPKGDKGDQGDPGPAGPGGRDGVNGRDGTNGSNGRDGTNGTNGVNGTNGRDGARGLNGRDALVTCKVTGASSSQKVTCTVTYGARAAAASTRARLVRNGRTYAQGSIGKLKATRKITRGRYTLRIASGKTVLRTKVVVR